MRILAGVIGKGNGHRFVAEGIGTEGGGVLQRERNILTDVGPFFVSYLFGLTTEMEDIALSCLQRLTF